jgi:erythromycin esterase-like protein
MILAERQLLLDRLRTAVRPLINGAHDYDALLESVGSARCVLLGEASHGSEEFYRERALITRRLIEDYGFSAVAIEADWPDALRVHRYVAGLSQDRDSDEALAGFERFPTWMWRNSVTTEFVSWLRAWNDRRPEASHKVGFFGLDLYSLRASMAAVIDYLDSVDPPAARLARENYACFDRAGGDPETYAWLARRDGEGSCEDAALRQLLALQQGQFDRLSHSARDTDERFYAEQNARVVRNAEEYYRTMLRGHVHSWNIRDRHMAETLGELEEFLARQGRTGGLVVWAHNSHLGDARATEMGEADEVNLGQLVRERHGESARLVGFSTYAGTVTAASDWGLPAERFHVRPALEGSYEELFHDVGIAQFILETSVDPWIKDALAVPRLERAIGVVYRPDTERQSHYFRARLSDQFDWVLHFDQTHALEPLDRNARWNTSEVPETFPSGV